MHGALRNTCFSLDWFTSPSGSRDGLKQPGDEDRNTLDEALLAPQQARQPSRPPRKSVLEAAEAMTIASIVEGTLVEQQVATSILLTASMTTLQH